MKSLVTFRYHNTGGGSLRAYDPMKKNNFLIVMLLVLLAAFTLTACNPELDNGPAEEPEEKPFVSKLPKVTGDSHIYGHLYKNTNNGVDTYIAPYNLHTTKPGYSNWEDRKDWNNVKAYMIQAVGKNIVSLKAIVTDQEIAKNLSSTGNCQHYIAGNGQLSGRIFRIVGTYDMTIEKDSETGKTCIKGENHPTLNPDYQGWFDMVQDLEHEGKYIIADELYVEFDDERFNPNIPEGVWVGNNFIEYKDYVMEGERLFRWSSGKSVVNIPDITPLAFYGTWEDVGGKRDLPFELPEYNGYF